MPRHPSGRILINTVDIAYPVDAQDADGGWSPTYPTVDRPGVPCSVQPRRVEEVVYEQDRVIQERQYVIVFAAATLVPARSRITYVDRDGVAHTLWARVERDEAGRGMAYTVHAIEKV